jgi:6,7-dimethyl-8-ribityllumazine synthase
MHPTPIEGEHAVGNLRFAIIAARFNDFIVESLIKGALEELERQGAGKGQVDLIRVPGAFELPIVARKLATLRRHDAIIALGAVIRGDTPHFDFVAGECASGLARIATDTGVPIAFGVLTTNTVEQAIERAGTEAGNKGGEAARTAIELANLLRQLEG